VLACKTGKWRALRLYGKLPPYLPTQDHLTDTFPCIYGEEYSNIYLAMCNNRDTFGMFKCPEIKHTIPLWFVMSMCEVGNICSSCGNSETLKLAQTDRLMVHLTNILFKDTETVLLNLVLCCL
jgi:hypothetical protein